MPNGTIPATRLVYVASPYSHPNRVVEETRNIGVAVAMGYLMNNFADYAFFSPICHTHPIATLCKLPGHWEFWKKYDEAMLSRCDEIWVLCLEGWEQSKGVTAEVNIAKDLGLTVKHILQQVSASYIPVGWIENPNER